MQRNASPLQRAIRQRRPFQSLGHEAIVEMLRTTDVVRRLYEDLFEAHGITLQQYNVLRILRGAGAEGLPTLSIRERMLQRTPGVTRLIDRLEARGWVNRETPKSDRRQVVCRITPRGLKMLKRLDEPVAEVDQATVEVLSEKDQRTLIRLLDAVRTSHERE